jgi:hypothetical protein
MRRYSEQNPPPASLWYKNGAYALAKGLTYETAKAYATLTWWGEHYGVRSPDITSGRRSAAYQAELRARWDRGDRRGLVARPALTSAHTEGRAFDLAASSRDLQILGSLAPYAGLRWGGTFSEPDPVHFDLRG